MLAGFLQSTHSRREKNGSYLKPGPRNWHSTAPVIFYWPKNPPSFKEKDQLYPLIGRISKNLWPSLIFHRQHINRLGNWELWKSLDRVLEDPQDKEAKLVQKYISTAVRTNHSLIQGHLSASKRLAGPPRSIVPYQCCSALLALSCGSHWIRVDEGKAMLLEPCIAILPFLVATLFMGHWHKQWSS